ncbi:MAG: NAD(P)H-hydrate dehydratase [Bacteroidota bacterium]
MIPILTPVQMSSADAYAIQRLQIPSLHLMENAGIAVTVEAIRRAKGIRRKKIAVLCGKGNNGGDGFVAARLLHEYGIEVTTVVLDAVSALSGDALVNYHRLAKENVVRFSDLKRKKEYFPEIIIDAMFGTSFRGSLQGKYLDAVRWCNERHGLKIAVDIPSGLNGETGEVPTEAFRADVTVTFSNPKTGLYFGRAQEYTGEVVIADIGLPETAIEKNAGNIFLTERNDIRQMIPSRSVNSHKHSVGKVFILAGSKGMMGASLLCAESSMRSGAGQTILGIPDSEYPIVAKRTREVMPFGLPSTDTGSISLSAAAFIEEKIQWSDVVVIGCGMARNQETMELVRMIIRITDRPMVVDADGLFALTENLPLLRNRRSRHIILTPHYGEFSRLTGVPSHEIERKKFVLAGEFAKTHGVTLVLKGAPTIIASPSGFLFVNPTGNPGMSTAGSGDVLAGMIGALLGQGLSPEAAAVTGVYLHGRAGDTAARKKGIHGMIASDIIRFVPDAFLSTVK